MNDIIQKQHEFLKTMQKSIAPCQNNLKIVNQFLQDFRTNIDKLASNLKVQTESFFGNVAQNDEADETFIFLYNYLFNAVLNVSHSLKDISDNIETDVVNIFNEFSMNYEANNKKLILNAQSSLQTIEENRTNMLKKKLKFQKINKKLSNLEIKINKLQKDNINEYQANLQIANKLKNQQEQIKQDYHSFIDNVNEKWSQYQSSILLCFDNFRLNEDSRKQITKTTIAMFLKVLEGQQQSLSFTSNIYNYTNFESKIKEIGSIQQRTLQQLLNQLNNTSKLIVLETDEVTNQTDNSVQESIEQQIQIEQDKYLSNLILKYLTFKQINELKPDQSYLDKFTFELPKNISSSQELIQEIINQKENHNFNKVIITEYFLKMIYGMSELENNSINLEQNIFEIFVFLGNKLIQYTEENNDKDPALFYKLIMFLVKFHQNDNKYDNVIKSMNTKSNIFYDQQRWENLYIKLDNQFKTLTSKNPLENQNNKKNKKGFFNTLQKFTKKLSILESPQKIQQDDTNLIFTSFDKNINPKILDLKILEEITNLFIKLHLDMIKTYDIIKSLCDRFNINRYQIEGILDLQMKQHSIQNCQFQINRAKTLKSIKTKKFESEVKSPFQIALKLSMNYHTLQDLQNLLLLNKNNKQYLSKHIAKRILILKRYSMSSQLRFQCWQNILNPFDTTIDYQSLKNQVLSTQNNQLLSIFQLIKLDVQRSFHHQITMNHQILNDLLKCYAIHNPEISYCQGMNFVMGFLYICINDEELTFKCFAKFFDQMLNDVYQQNLKYLNKHFYIIDRLIAYHIPDLAKHFNKEQIESSLFVPSWMLTLFSNSAQHMSNMSQLVVLMWDIFISQKWVGFYKVALSLFYKYKDDLMQFNFEQVMQFFNEFPRSQLMTANYGENKQCNEEITEFVQSINQFNIDKLMIQSIEMEYFQYKDIIDQILRKKE